MMKKNVPDMMDRWEENDEQTILESREYALSASGGYGKLCAAGRKTEYHYSGLGGDDLQFTGYGIDLGAAGALFL